tara:strand:- start:415 stop:1056 length:642 start_codon:yes stop_codon:yes gene_type:complete
MLTKKCVLLFSGKGSNIKNLINKQASLNGKLEYIAAFTNNPTAKGIDICSDNDIEVTISDQGELNSNLINFLSRYKPDLIILAGYMKILPDDIVNKYVDKIINIHPSLLPKYPGLNTYEKVLKNNDLYHGVTIHYVNTTLDGGPIILQGKFKIRKKLSIKELEDLTHKVEHKIYPIVVKWIADDLISVKDNIIQFNDKIIYSPITYVVDELSI